MATAAVDSTSAATSAATTSSGTGTASMSKDDFLKILMAQLENQDPLNPTDANQFVTELSQLTQVETLQNMQTDLDNLSTAMQQGNMGQWVSCIGHRMQVSSTAVSQGDEVLLAPSGSYDSLTLTLQDASGNQTTKTFSSSDSPVYSDTDGDYTIVSATATKNGLPTSCNYTVYRTIAAVQPGTAGTSLVSSDGTAYPTSSVIQIIQ